MRVIAAITDPVVPRRILECVGLPPRAPSLSPASPQDSVAKPWSEEPDEDFDQMPPDNGDSGA